MKLFDWFALKVKRILIQVVSPDLKGMEEYWDEVDPQDELFAGLLLVLGGLVVSIILVCLFW